MQLANLLHSDAELHVFWDDAHEFPPLLVRSVLAWLTVERSASVRLFGDPDPGSDRPALYTFWRIVIHLGGRAYQAAALREESRVILGPCVEPH